MAKFHPVAIVTGGAKGIGRAIAAHLREHKGGSAPSTCRARRAPGVPRNRAVALSRAMWGRDTTGRAVAAALSRFGRLDAVVSNAGIMTRKPCAAWHWPSGSTSSTPT